MQWEKSADDAHSDDIKCLALEVANWLNTMDKDHVAKDGDWVYLDPHDRRGRGFQHKMTGCLLCPIEYDWETKE